MHCLVDKQTTLKMLGTFRLRVQAYLWSATIEIVNVPTTPLRKSVKYLEEFK